jgi:hypothetical protein
MENKKYRSQLESFHNEFKGTTSKQKFNKPTNMKNTNKILFKYRCTKSRSNNTTPRRSVK